MKNELDKQSHNKRNVGFRLHPNLINRNGRPRKEFSITNALEELLKEKDPATKIERYKLLLQKALAMAMKGDGDMLKYLINRIEGMPKGSLEGLNIKDSKVQFNVIYSDANNTNTKTEPDSQESSQIQSN